MAHAGKQDFVDMSSSVRPENDRPLHQPDGCKMPDPAGFPAERKEYTLLERSGAVATAPTPEGKRGLQEFLESDARRVRDHDFSEVRVVCFTDGPVDQDPVEPPGGPAFPDITAMYSVRR